MAIRNGIFIFRIVIAIRYDISILRIIAIHHECPCKIGKSHSGGGGVRGSGGGGRGISTGDEAC